VVVDVAEEMRKAVGDRIAMGVDSNPALCTKRSREEPINFSVPGSHPFDYFDQRASRLQDGPMTANTRTIAGGRSRAVGPRPQTRPLHPTYERVSLSFGWYDE
jgi:hypothetical protein